MIFGFLKVPRIPQDIIDLQSLPPPHLSPELFLKMFAILYATFACIFQTLSDLCSELMYLVKFDYWQYWTISWTKVRYYCLSVLLSVCIIVCLYYCLSVLLSDCITVCLYYCLSVSQFRSVQRREELSVLFVFHL